ncbi:MAG: winged helix-turn-helix transcriptional regulator [Sphingomicrobium sp.]
MKLEKTTKRSLAETKRGYEDACGLAHALELIGERWAPLVLRELWLGPRRFSGLRASLPGISANVLTQRLGELEERGLVRRKKLPPPASVQVYEATEWAMDAAPMLCELGRWASRSPGHDPRYPVSPVAIMMSMKVNFDPSRADSFKGCVAFEFDEARYFAEVRDGTIKVERGDPTTADATISCDPDALKPVLYGGAPIESLPVEGDVEVARRFMTLFSLPPKVG